MDDKGAEYFTIHVRDTETGEDLADRIEGTTGDTVWAGDGKTFFYVWVDENHRPARVFRHVVGTAQSDDVIVYEDHHPGFFIGVGETQSRRFVTIATHDHETAEFRVLETDRPEGTPRLIARRRKAEEYHLDHGDDRFFIMTNADGAEDFKIVTAPIAKPGRRHWKDLVPHVPGRLILNFTVYKTFLVRLERESSLPRIVIRHLATGEEHAIAFDEEAYSLGILDGYEFDTTMLRFTYSSMTTPAEVFDYDMETRERAWCARRKRSRPAMTPPTMSRGASWRRRRTARRCRSRCSTARTRRSTARRRVLYGYGSYGIAIPAGLQHQHAVAGRSRLRLCRRPYPRRQGEGLSLVFRTGVGRRRSIPSRTSFQQLTISIEEKFTARGRIVGWGGSAGGLLIGAVANMAPALFAGMIAEVPFVDTLNTILDDTCR